MSRSFAAAVRLLAEIAIGAGTCVSVLFILLACLPAALVLAVKMGADRLVTLGISK